MEDLIVEKLDTLLHEFKIFRPMCSIRSKIHPAIYNYTRDVPRNKFSHIDNYRH